MPARFFCISLNFCRACGLHGSWLLCLLTAVLWTSLPQATATAALPPEVRKELTDLQKEVREVAPLIRRKQIAEAKALLERVEARIAELMIAEDEKDRAWTSLKSQLERAQLSIPVSFEHDVAPILKASCLRCHGAEQASGNLRLDTYNSMARGGRTGPLAVPRRPLQSLLLGRLMATNEQQRMPRGGARLSEAEIATIGRWIEQGAEFDGENRDAPIGDSTMEKKPPVQVVMATGNETVSFTKDLAPWFVNICLGCHSGANPRGGYNITTFEQLLTDGDTGHTIVPGNPDGSYIVDLVLRQEPLKMPAGQAQLKRSQAEALETWIREGAHFDGTDPKAPLRSLVPTEAEMEAAKLASMTDAEFSERRTQQAADLWKRVSPRATGASITTTHLIVHGNVEEGRLQTLGDWGEAHLAALTERYKLPAGEKPWRGRLIVFVGKDRFDYEEFNTVLMNGRRTPKSVSGHILVTPNFETAYVAMHDVGDTATADTLSAQYLLNSLLSQAYLNRDGSNLPDWLRQGFGTLEAGIPAGSEYLKTIPARAATALATITDPAKIFDDGTFAPDEVGPVGYLLVRFLTTQRGAPRLQQLIQELRTNPNAGRAVQQAYGETPASLGQAFLRAGVR